MGVDRGKLGRTKISLIENVIRVTIAIIIEKINNSSMDPFWYRCE